MERRNVYLDNVGLYNRFGLPSANRKWMYHFLGREEDYEPQRKKRNHVQKRQERDLDEGDEQVFLIETTTGLKYEKKHAGEIFADVSRLNDLLIARDDRALNTLENEFSQEHMSALCFDGNKVCVWKDTNGSSNCWDVDYYLNNFMFRFEHEPETKHLRDEAELNKWLTFRFLQIREGIESREIYRLKKELVSGHQDKDYIVDMYNRWLDNESEIPFERNPLIEQLLSQAYDFIFEKDSGNRVFQMITNMPKDRRRIALGR